MEINKVNLSEKFDAFSAHWTPKIVGELNDQLVKVAKLKGEFVAHKHEKEDELFLVIEGELKIELDDKTLELKAGEMVIIPKGVTHKPIAEEEVKVLLFEPKTVRNTGNIENDLTVTNLDKI